MIVSLREVGLKVLRLIELSQLLEQLDKVLAKLRILMVLHLDTREELEHALRKQGVEAVQGLHIRAFNFSSGKA